MCSITSIFFPFALIFLIYISVCLLPFLGSIFIPTICGTDSFNTSNNSTVMFETVPKSTCISILHHIILPIELLFYFRTVMSGSLILECFFPTGIFCLWESLKNFQNKIQRKSEIKIFILSYRKIQIIEGLCNAAFAKRITPAVIGPISFIQTYAAFLCIAMKKHVPITNYVLYIISVLASLLINIVFLTAGSQIYSVSGKILKSWEYKLCEERFRVRKFKLFRKELASCPKLKVKFGTNFIEESTPLVIQDFCWRQSATLILLFA